MFGQCVFLKRLSFFKFMLFLSRVCKIEVINIKYKNCQYQNEPVFFDKVNFFCNLVIGGF